MRVRAALAQRLAGLGRLCLAAANRFEARGEQLGTQGRGAQATSDAANTSSQSLADSGNLLQTLLASSPDVIYFKDRQSRFVHYSASFCRHFGLATANALQGKTDFDMFTAEHAQPAFDDEQEIIRTGKPMIGRTEKETYADGRVTWALTDKMPWRDKDGNIVGTFGISKDITAMKEAESKLAQERELLRTLLDNVPDSIYFKDRQSRFVHVSKSKARKTLQRVPELHTRHLERAAAEGRAPSSETEILVGLTDFDVYKEEDARPAFEDEQEIIRTGKPVIDKQEKQRHLDGSVGWSLSTKMPWRDKDGAIIGTFGISRDVTALKKAEEELQAAHKRLVETSRLAGMAEVATDVLHNVGNTLNSINVSCSLAIETLREANLANLAKIPALIEQNRGRLERFLTEDPQGKRIPEYLSVIAQTFDEQKQFLTRELEQLQRNIEHVNQIVSMQQSYAKVAGLEETVEVSQLVEDALQINDAALERHGVTVVRELERGRRLLVDKHRVLQILVNLIRNAKYALTESEREDKLLTVRVAQDGAQQLKIQVIDNGIGIPAENLTRIFSHGFTTRRDGHGFGLHSGALSARDLGGSLVAQSDGPGKGATFTLALPLKTVSEKK